MSLIKNSEQDTQPLPLEEQPINSMTQGGNFKLTLAIAGIGIVVLLAGFPLIDRYYSEENRLLIKGALAAMFGGGSLTSIASTNIQGIKRTEIKGAIKVAKAALPDKFDGLADMIGSMLDAKLSSSPSTPTITEPTLTTDPTTFVSSKTSALPNQDFDLDTPNDHEGVRVIDTSTIDTPSSAIHLPQTTSGNVAHDDDLERAAEFILNQIQKRRQS